VKPVAAMVAITLLALSGLLGAVPFAGTGVAQAAETGAPATAPGQGPAAQGPLSLDLTQLSPRVVTSGGPRTLTVTGTLTNTGDRPIGDLVIRAQRGNPLQTEGALRDALDGSGNAEGVTPQFVPIPGELAPGGQLPVQLTVPLRGPTDTTLALSATGVHELLINVNGAPRDGARARLAAVRVLLPVLSLPPDPAAPDQVPEAPTAGAAPFAMLYPVTDTPRRIPTVPGEVPVLTDDDLAASFAPGGRLGELVAALAQNAPTGSRLRAATCLAVDPDLVETASLMRQPAGYQVRLPDGGTAPGTGGQAAGQWLDQLAAVARTGCVIALPYADADLVALTRGGMGDLAASAIDDGRTVLDDILQITSVPEATWPVDGVADEATLDITAAADGRAVVLSADGVEQGRTQRTSGLIPLAGGSTPQFAVLTDPLLTRAAAGPGATVLQDTDRGTGSVRPAPVASASPAGGPGPLSTQDLVGALAFRTESPPDAAERGGGPLVLAPPHAWTADGAAARALLGAVDQLLDANRIVPRALDAVLTTGPPPDANSFPPTYPLQVGGQEVPGSVVDALHRTSGAIDDLESAAVADAGVGVSPDEVFTPLRRGLLRPVSAAFRGRPDAATAASRTTADRVAELRATVRVLEPPSPYSLGTSDAPILITLTNGLPVTVQVRVEISSSSGLRVAPIEPQLVPPLGRRQVRVSAEVVRAGQFTVQASVRTPDGELLGPASRLRVRSTVYGTITVWLTASAGVLLVVLAARRVLRRVRGEPGTGRHSGPDHPVPPSGPRPEGAAGRPAPSPDPRPSPGAHRSGDPFPDPLAATDRLPAARPHPEGPPRPPGPPRVPSP
jgi:Family of unknown function (DUF6049)